MVLIDSASDFPSKSPSNRPQVRENPPSSRSHLGGWGPCFVNTQPCFSVCPAPHFSTFSLFFLPHKTTFRPQRSSFLPQICKAFLHPYRIRFQTFPNYPGSSEIAIHYVVVPFSKGGDGARIEPAISRLFQILPKFFPLVALSCNFHLNSPTQISPKPRLICIRPRTRTLFFSTRQLIIHVTVSYLFICFQIVS